MSKETLLKEFRKQFRMFNFTTIDDEFGHRSDYSEDDIESFLSHAIDQTREETIREEIDILENFFTPATSTRCQGGLPLHGTVKDWTITITKDGWEQLKQSLINLNNNKCICGEINSRNCPIHQ